MKFRIILMIYTYYNDYFLNNHTAKYIDIESNISEKFDHFLIELQILI